VADDGQQRSGLTLLDGVLLVGGAIIAVWVAFAVLHFVVGVVWFVIKAVVLVALIVLVARLLLRRH